MTEDAILDGVIEREGGFVNDPRDAGGPTRYGITQATLASWRHAATVSVAEVEALTVDEARAIYRQRYIERPGFTVANIPFEPLRVALIDWGINSGPARAIRWLQRVISLPPTGVLDHRTVVRLKDIIGYETKSDDTLARIVNDALVAARLYMIDSATDQGSVSKTFEEGLESRALSFFLATPEPVIDSGSRKA